MLNDKYEEASQLVVDIYHSEGYGRKRATDSFIPAFRLNIESDSTDIKQYARTVNFESGEIEVKWEDDNGTFSRKTFISRPDNVIVIRLKSNKGSYINTTMNLSQITTFDDRRRIKFEMDENLEIEKVESGAYESGLSFRAWYERTWNSSYKGYKGALNVIESDGDIQFESNEY